LAASAVQICIVVKYGVHWHEIVDAATLHRVSALWTSATSASQAAQAEAIVFRPCRLTRVDDIVDELSQANGLRILVLDSCRVNPLADELSRSMELTRGPPVDRGVARMIAPKAMIVSFATQPNQTAADEQGRNSPYTMAFLKNIKAPEEIGAVFHHMTADVYNETQGKQLPELSLSYIGDFYLKNSFALVPNSRRSPSWRRQSCPLHAQFRPAPVAPRLLPYRCHPVRQSHCRRKRNVRSSRRTSPRSAASGQRELGSRQGLCCLAVGQNRQDISPLQ
jgi:Caspase domain